MALVNDRVLFILKEREGYWGGSYTCLSSGLRNSVSFVVKGLESIGIEAKLVEVVDNNSIDAEVKAYKPTHVIIEAFWVVPEKFDELMPLHPNVRWIVRNHSEVPFLANEGIAFGWIAGYLKRGVEIMCNSPRAVSDIRNVALSYGISDRLVTYGPNLYPLIPNVFPKQESEVLKIGCFGAIRPLKNTMAQALAALAVARHANLNLEFHVNASRLEGNGEPILKNLRQMFDAVSNHKLVEHEWIPHEEFLKLISQMHVVTQVSFSETFNIVAADAVMSGVPVVVSREIPWVGNYAHADPTNTNSIVDALVKVLNAKKFGNRLLHLQVEDLTKYCQNSLNIWRQRFVAYDKTF